MTGLVVRVEIYAAQIGLLGYNTRHGCLMPYLGTLNHRNTVCGIPKKFCLVEVI